MNFHRINGLLMKINSIWIFLAYQFDVQITFLNDVLHECIFMELIRSVNNPIWTQFNMKINSITELGSYKVVKI